MKTKTIYISAIIFFSTISCSITKKHQNHFLFLQTDTTKLIEKYAYTNRNNKIIVPYGKYNMCWTDTIRSIGFVMKTGSGCVAIDNKGNELFKVYVVDNGNDYPSEGIFRILNDTEDKMGYADMNGKILVSPKYDAVTPFSEGMAAVANGTQKIDISDGEGRFVFKGGSWGFIDKKGKEVIPLMYDSIASPCRFENGKIKVLKNGCWFYIDKNNKQIIES